MLYNPTVIYFKSQVFDCEALKQLCSLSFLVHLNITSWYNTKLKLSEHNCFRASQSKTTDLKYRLQSDYQAGWWYVACFINAQGSAKFGDC